MSHKRTDSTTWSHHRTSKQGVDGWFTNAEMGEGDLAQVHRKEEEPSCVRYLQSTFHGRSKAPFPACVLFN